MDRKVIIILLISFLLMGLDRTFGLSWLRLIGQSVLSPVSYGIYQIGFQTRQITDFIVSLPFVYKENRVWEAKVKELEADLVSLVEIQQENKVLRDQLNVLAVRDEEMILARVVGSQTKGDSLVLMVDKGVRDGVYEGVVAINGNALVGRVVDVQPNTSYILPIFAVDSRVPVKISSTNDQKTVGIVVGRYNDRVILTDVLQEQSLFVGDLLISSGEGGIFPVGYYVGKITKVESEEAAIFKTATIDPSITLETLTSVFIKK